jgi:hypothetical protein
MDSTVFQALLAEIRLSGIAIEKTNASWLLILER